MLDWESYNYFIRILIIFQYKNFFLIFTNKNITACPLFYFTKTKQNFNIIAIFHVNHISNNFSLPGRNRTYSLKIRSLSLYPIELQGDNEECYISTYSTLTYYLASFNTRYTSLLSLGSLFSSLLSLLDSLHRTLDSILRSIRPSERSATRTLNSSKNCVGLTIFPGHCL